MNRLTGMVCLVLAGCAGCKTFQPAGEFGQNLVDIVTGDTPLRAVARMEDRFVPDERRRGINRLVDRGYGRREPYTDRYAEIAQLDSHHLVRATAIRALNRSRDDRFTSVYIKSLADPHPLVRQEAAKALANMPDDQAIQPLIRIVTNLEESRDVRIAAADALRNYRHIPVARALVGLLGGRDFGVSWQARQSLVRMTGQDLRYNDAQWLEYLTRTEHPFI